MASPLFYVHPTAEVSPDAQVGAGTRIWRQAHIREHAQIGEQCNIGKGVYIDAHVRIGSRVKIQNHVSIFEGVTLEDGVFIGPHVCFTNDLAPRAITPDGRFKSADDWEIAADAGEVRRVDWRGRGDRVRHHHRHIRAGRCGRGGDARRAAARPGVWQSCPPAWLCVPLRAPPGRGA